MLARRNIAQYGDFEVGFVQCFSVMRSQDAVGVAADVQVFVY